VSENVFNVVGIGRQSGTFDAPGAAVAASILWPVESPVNIELDRGSAYPKQDRGRNVRNNRNSGYHGVRMGSVTLPGQVRFEDVPDLLEMIYAGDISPAKYVSRRSGITRQIASPTIRTRQNSIRSQPHRLAQRSWSISVDCELKELHDVFLK
jgi:hypothetical protein